MQKRLVPSAELRPTHGDVPQLIEEVQTGDVDIALVTLPLAHPDIHVEELRRDRLVVCIRKDSPLANKAALVVGDLKDHLRIFYHPQKHPDAHYRLLELLTSVGVNVREFSRASHPYEMQALVRAGFGVALVREGMALDDQLTTRPVSGIDWTIDTALIYRKQLHPKTIPILVRQFKKQFAGGTQNNDSEPASTEVRNGMKRPNASVPTNEEGPIQLRLLG